MMLLTTVDAMRTRKTRWQVVQGYITRWRVEDTISFVKQSYKLEHVRCLDCRRLKNMAALVGITTHDHETPKSARGLAWARQPFSKVGIFQSS